MSQEAVSTSTSLEQTLKRCRPEVIEAAKSYQKGKDPKLLPTIVVGVLERYVEPERRGPLQQPKIDELKLQTDLGMDSLVMVEVVMTLEEVLGQQIPDTELRGLVTIGDTLEYVQAKATGAALPTPPDRLVSEMVTMLLPGQTPLVGDVVLRPAKAEAVYAGAAPTAEDLLKAAEQLASLWAQRKSQAYTSSPNLVQKELSIDASLPVQLRMEKGDTWSVFYLQTSRQAVMLGTV